MSHFIEKGTGPFEGIDSSPHFAAFPKYRSAENRKLSRKMGYFFLNKLPSNRVDWMKTTKSIRFDQVPGEESYPLQAHRERKDI